MKNMKQIIAFRRCKVLVTNNKELELDLKRAQELQTFKSEFERFGYHFDGDVLKRISTEEMTEYLHQVLPLLKEKFHDDLGGDFEPLWPGFPDQVLEMDQDTLSEIQRKIYDKELSYDDPIFSYNKKEDGDGVVVKTPVILGVMSEDEFNSIPEAICSLGTAPSDQTKEELAWFLENMKDCKLPSTIPFKETLVMVMDKRPDYLPSELTDILRLGVYKLTGSSEFSSSKQEKVASISRKDRRHIISMLEQLLVKKSMETNKSIEIWVENTSRHIGQWILLLRNLHCGDYRKKFPVTMEFCKVVLSKDHGRKNVETWNSKLQKLYDANADLDNIAEFISHRPGELLRRLDSILRRYIREERNINNFLINTLGKAFNNSKNKTLLEVLNYYRGREEDRGRIVKFKNKEGNWIHKEIPALPAMPKDVVEAVISVMKTALFCKIINKFSGDEMLNHTVVLDKLLEEVPIPVDMRGDSSIPRGTRFDIPESVNTIRFFVHWLDNAGIEDIDLHGYFSDESFSDFHQVGWNSNLASKLGVYSGDVRNRRGKCSEYVDINIEEAIKAGYRYALVSLNNYYGRGFDTLPCWSGYEYLTKGIPVASDKWTPKDPTFMTKLTSTSSSLQAWLFDLVERKAVLVNMAVGNNAIVPNQEVCSTIVKIITKCCDYVNCFNLLEHYYQSQGATVVTSQDYTEPEPVGGEEVKVLKITKDDIVQDYTKILQILGD